MGNPKVSGRDPLKSDSAVAILVSPPGHRGRMALAARRRYRGVCLLCPHLVVSGNESLESVREAVARRRETRSRRSLKQPVPRPSIELSQADARVCYLGSPSILCQVSVHMHRQTRYLIWRLSTTAWQPSHLPWSLSVRSIEILYSRSLASYISVERRVIFTVDEVVLFPRTSKSLMGEGCPCLGFR